MSNCTNNPDGSEFIAVLYETQAGKLEYKKELRKSQDGDYFCRILRSHNGALRSDDRLGESYLVSVIKPSCPEDGVIEMFFVGVEKTDTGNREANAKQVARSVLAHVYQEGWEISSISCI